MPTPQRHGLILDFGGVLTTPVADSTRAFCHREGLAPDAFLDIISVDPVGRELYKDLELGAITQAAWNTRTAPLLGVDATNLIGRALADLRPEPTMLAAVRSARQAGVKVALLTNSIGSDPYDPYEDYGLDTLCDAVVLSEHHGIRKPDPAIYTIALEAIGLPAQECVFVDDSPRNLTPASDLGIATALDTTPAETIPQLENLLGIPLH
ncbi:HAD family phosphatase [Streptomyces sp. NBC_00091]|uniref:HAD family hydrolase n=1 Tax=Streptomyces sp. NBC_00091 TaxID=2975648 RepID=UPI0022515DC0|nr:HAD family phosphatase [Streptomyces sp. NBC_00091]MCX5380357.1 HAD family phosphatase [Streptomyces sp. NBC_00091]